MKIPSISPLLDFFFPLYCAICGKQDFFSRRIALCAHCVRKTRSGRPLLSCSVCSGPLRVDSELCRFCDSRNVFFDRAFSIRGRNDLLSEVLNRLKSRREYPLSLFLGTGAKSILHRMKSEAWEAYCFLPSHKKGIFSSDRERPFLPAKRLGDIIERTLGIPCINPLWKTSPEKQAGKSYSERFFHAHGAWRMRKEWQGRCPSRLILVDDIFTTGASVNEASRILKQNGAGKIAVFTYLRTLD